MQVKLASLHVSFTWLAVGWGKPGAGGNSARRSLLRAGDESINPAFIGKVTSVDLGSLATEGCTKELLGLGQLRF